MTPWVVPLPGNEALARSLTRSVDGELGQLETRKFPDGESYLRIDPNCSGRSVALVCTLDRPDAKLLPLLFAADTARELGAARVGLVAPYLAYMRQDRRFREGEAVTSRIFADLLSSRLDWLLTVDPHLHRYHSLEELYRVPARVVHAAPALAAWIAEAVDRPLLIGPDEESAQWVADVGSRVGAPHLVLTKIRRGDHDVEVSVPRIEEHRDRTPVVLDDIVSSARTMIQTVRHLVDAGLPSPVCLAVHAVLAEPAEKALREAGAAALVSTNTIVHSTNAIDLAPLLGPVLGELVL
ncbi:MAG: ribose-phosphate pyrophosphokinase [Myxococcales bacterium]|nr:ribose-phosphate pyrophosphokinase [Myxococcales bacterium]